MTERTRGRLIALEGGEGVGKSTQAELLAGALGAKATREPGGSRLGEQVRSLVLDSPPGAVDDRAELMLVLAARAQHVAELIRPALQSGRDVVVDRYSGSTLAYQGYGRGLPIDEIEMACDLATGGLWPDLTVLLDMPAEEGAARRAGTRRDRIESEGPRFFARVREGYLELASKHPGSWVVLDASPGAAEVASAVLKAVRAL
ncbi:MAG: dTMP kinase [Acidimicrobiales bacterium]